MVRGEVFVCRRAGAPPRAGARAARRPLRGERASRRLARPQHHARRADLDERTAGQLSANVLVEQTTVVDPGRLGRSAGRLATTELKAVDEALTLVLGL
jgi:hypothetical protein